MGFKAISMEFELDTDADRKKLEKLVELTERYCVVYQTLTNDLQTASHLTLSS